MSLVQKITKSQRGINLFVEYIIGNLLYDNTRAIKRVQDTEMDDIRLRKELHKKLGSVIDSINVWYNAILYVEEDVA